MSLCVIIAAGHWTAPRSPARDSGRILFATSSLVVRHSSFVVLRLALQLLDTYERPGFHSINSTCHPERGEAVVDLLPNIFAAKRICSRSKDA
jgi:hypothetical protein